MASVSVEVQLSLAWWLVPYVYGLAFFCEVMGTEPDPEKLERVIARAVRIRVPGGRWHRLRRI